VAVFHAFSRVVNEARSAFVVLDTAPTGHSLLLMDATGAYHRQMMQPVRGAGRVPEAKHIITPLMRLQDPSMTRVLIVTLPEVTPVSQAAALQDDLRRAKIEPWAWVINKSVAATGTSDPLLQARLAGERRQAQRISNGLARRTFVLPWLPEPPMGVGKPDSVVRGALALNDLTRGEADTVRDGALVRLVPTREATQERTSRHGAREHGHLRITVLAEYVNVYGLGGDAELGAQDLSHARSVEQRAGADDALMGDATLLCEHGRQHIDGIAHHDE
jgi:hypothetical protein